MVIDNLKYSNKSKMYIARKLRILRWMFEKSMCYSLVLVITPYFFIFEMVVVRPNIIKSYNLSATKHAFHILFSIFLFVNIIGNMVLGIFTDTTIKMCGALKDSDGTYCEFCKTNRPENAWHCKVCNICILKRDHHCFFFSRCIGLRNQRFYIAYLTYIFVSMLYSTYFNYYYVVTKFEDHDMFWSVARFINPFIRYLLPEPLNIKDFYVFFLFLNLGLVLWSGALFSLHMRNLLKGVTSYENKERRGRRSFMPDWSVMRRNFIGVFGTKWYLAILWPLAHSPLPQNDGDKKAI